MPKRSSSGRLFSSKTKVISLRSLGETRSEETFNIHVKELQASDVSCTHSCCVSSSLAGLGGRKVVGDSALDSKLSSGTSIAWLIVEERQEVVHYLLGISLSLYMFAMAVYGDSVQDMEYIDGYQRVYLFLFLRRSWH